MKTRLRDARVLLDHRYDPAGARCLSAELLHIACDVAVAMLLYALLKPVDRNIALLAAFMRPACDVVLAMASLTGTPAG
jgi:hypothetical protein